METTIYGLGFGPCGCSKDHGCLFIGSYSEDYVIEERMKDNSD